MKTKHRLKGRFVSQADYEKAMDARPQAGHQDPWDHRTHIERINSEMTSPSHSPNLGVVRR